MHITIIWGGVDIANQLRASFTTLRAQNFRYWRPLFYWLLDIALTNSYLLFLTIIEPSRGHRTHKKYLEALLGTLMAYQEPLEPLEPPEPLGPIGPLEPLEHNQILRAKRGYCAYCSRDLNWQPKHCQPKPRPMPRFRAFGAVLTNNRGSRSQIGLFRGSRTQWGCQECNKPLCKIGDCWHLWHRNITNS